MLCVHFKAFPIYPCNAHFLCTLYAFLSFLSDEQDEEQFDSRTSMQKQFLPEIDKRRLVI